MRIGIDFDNTIICYDQVFCDLAKSLQLVPAYFEGSKKELRDHIRLLPDGELTWQRLQGKAYGEHISTAHVFPGFEFFLARALQAKNVELFIVSHKTEFGHFDDARVSLRDAARAWLGAQDFFHTYPINHANIFFETTREEKIARIRALQCTHFIDDLVEVLTAENFPPTCARYLFSAQHASEENLNIPTFTHWNDLTNAIFSSCDK